MNKPLNNLPVFDETDFRAKTADWKAYASRLGFRVCVEWNTVSSAGPQVFVYPSGERAKGFPAFARQPLDTLDERWADYLELEYIPQIVRALEADGYPVDVMCVDLRPLQVQRARRRALEAAAQAKAGVPAAAAH